MPYDISKDGLLSLNAPRLIQYCMMCTLHHPQTIVHAVHTIVHATYLRVGRVVLLILLSTYKKKDRGKYVLRARKNPHTL